MLFSNKREKVRMGYFKETGIACINISGIPTHLLTLFQFWGTELFLGQPSFSANLLLGVYCTSNMKKLLSLTLSFKALGLRTYAVLLNNKANNDSFELTTGISFLNPCLFV